MAKAWIEFAGGNAAEAERLLRTASDSEDATEKSAVTPGPLMPARESLGDLLLELKRPAEALNTLETAISQWDQPTNPDTPTKVGLLNLYAQVLRKSGRKVDARRAEAQAREADGLLEVSLVRKTVDIRDLGTAPRK